MATEIRKDAFAFCHGMLGFGEDEKLNSILPYFGGASCTNSALHPLDEDWQDFEPGKDTPVKGIWNVMPIMRRDHGGCVGLGIEAIRDPEPIRKYYRDYFEMLRNLA